MCLQEVVRLHCLSSSQLAVLHWEGPRDELSPNIYIQEDSGVLNFLATPMTLGIYSCRATENGFTQTLAVYEVIEKGEPTPQASSTSPTRHPEILPRPTSPLEMETPPDNEENNPTQKATPSTFASSAIPSSTSTVSADGLTNMLQRETHTSYLKELVAVSVLLVMCVCALLLVAAYTLRKSYRSRTVAHSSPGCRDAEGTEGGTDQEREALRGSSPHVDKHNGQKSPNTPSNGVSNGSNGHLPNIPI